MTQIIALIDGTLSRLENNQETHAGKLFKLVLKLPPNQRRIFYDAGVQGFGYEKWLQVASGTGLNLSVVKTYQKISEHFRDGDELFLFGYSRGAFAIRLIAGMINRIGLLKPEFANLGYADAALRLYGHMSEPMIVDDFCASYCRKVDRIAFLGVWDTVKALGIRLPLFHHLTPFKIDFKDREVPEIVSVARHALAYHEDRWIYEPELWDGAPQGTNLEQMLFAGDHGVVGGNIHYNQQARKLGNYSFVWMIEEAMTAGMKMPAHWRDEFPRDIHAPCHDRAHWYDIIWLHQPRKYVPSENYLWHPSLKHYLENRNSA